MKLTYVRSPAVRRLLEIISVAAIYYISARLSLLLSIPYTNASPVWPPAGIALAAMLIFGYRVWPGIFAGAFFANIFVLLIHPSVIFTSAVTTSFLIGIGNTLEAVVGCLMLGFMAGKEQFSLLRVQNILKFIFTALSVCLISAFIGPASLCFFGLVPWEMYKTVWYTWWLGDMAGILVFTPLFLSVKEYSFRSWKRWQLAEALIFASSLLTTAYIIFGGVFAVSTSRYPVSYVFLPFVVWSAFRFGQLGVALSVVAISVTAVLGTLNGFGPFAAATQNESLLILQTFASTVGIIGLVLAGLLADRRQAEGALRKAYTELEYEVQKRTEELRYVNESLKKEISDRLRVDAELRTLNSILTARLSELELLNRIMMDREERILELKEQIKILQSSSEHQAKNFKTR